MVLRTLSHQPVDRMPIDLGSHTATGISLFAYAALREHLDLPSVPITACDVVQCLAHIDTDVLERFHCDCVLLEPRWPGLHAWRPRPGYEFWVPEAFAPTQREDGSWIASRGTEQMRMPSGGYFFDGAWLSSWQSGTAEHLLALYAAEARRIHEETDYASLYIGHGAGLGFPAFFGGIEQGLRMIEDPRGVLEDNERRLDHAVRLFDRINRSFGRYVQLISISDDMGGQDRTLARPAHLEEFCIPFYERLCRHVHDNSDIKVFLHSCGSVREVIPALVEAGVDVLNPVQISAKRMDPVELKRSFGERLVFWGGGCNTQGLLGTGSAPEIRRHVTSLVHTLKPGGGYVFNQVHNIQGDVPPQNIVAMLDAAYEHSFYDR